MSALLGGPATLTEQEISAKLPTFGGSVQKSLALDMHVKLAETTAFIQQSRCGIRKAHRRFTNCLAKLYTVSKVALAIIF